MPSPFLRRNPRERLHKRVAAYLRMAHTSIK